MLNAAEKMKSIGKAVRHPPVSSSLFGSGAELAQSVATRESFRISVYPILCAAMPESAMGIAACLSYLLEQYREVKVYRCFAKIDPADDSAEITADDCQFAMSDWEFEGLDDNAALSGELTQTEAGLRLRLFIDLSLLGNEDGGTLDFDAATLPELINVLPQAAAQIAAMLSGNPSSQLVISYPPLTADAPDIDRLLEIVFDWNLDLYLYLWDVDWDDDDVLEQFTDIDELSARLQNGFAFWCLGMMAKQVMHSGLENIGEAILPRLNHTLDARRQYPHGGAAIAAGLSAFGHADRAAQFLEGYPLAKADASVWGALIDIYLKAGQLVPAIDASQRALEHGLEHPALYWRYAQILMMAETNDTFVEEVILIDPDEIGEDEQIAFEIIQSLKGLLTLAPQNLNALQLALSYMIEAADDELWSYFARLVQADRAALYVSDIIERLIDIADLNPACEILQNAISSNPDEPYFYLYLAQLALVDENSDLAKTSIAACRQTVTQPDNDLELELQRLELVAALPDFEQRLAEIRVMLNARRHVAESDVEFLEEALEIAPGIIDLYLTLAACYQSWNDAETAYEVLTEAEQRVGGHPQIVRGLVDILWRRRQHEQAVEKLNAALGDYPNDIYLLAQMAHYLIENRQLDDARQYIERAESIAPTHSEVWKLRQLIARKLAN